MDIEKVEPYLDGSHAVVQEWVKESLAKLDPKGEMFRFYEYLLKARTYQMLHDKDDYEKEYNRTKKFWQDWLDNPSHNATPAERESVKNQLGDDNWQVTIQYPSKESFNLNEDKILQVNKYLRAANPQFFLGRNTSYLSADGRFVTFDMPTYYLSADNRKKTHKKILDGFASFKAEFEKEFKKSGIDINNPYDYDVAKYVFDDITKTLDTTHGSSGYVSRAAAESANTIMSYFGDKPCRVRRICTGSDVFAKQIRNPYNNANRRVA